MDEKCRNGSREENSENSLSTSLPDPTSIMGLDPNAPMAADGLQSLLDYRFDLLDPGAMFRLAKILNLGDQKGYGEGGWRSVSVSDHINHALGHIYGWLLGNRQGDHLAHAFCRLMFAVATEECKRGSEVGGVAHNDSVIDSVIPAAERLNDSEPSEGDAVVVHDETVIIDEVPDIVAVGLDKDEGCAAHPSSGSAATDFDSDHFYGARLHSGVDNKPLRVLYICAPLSGDILANVRRVRSAVNVLVNEYRSSLDKQLPLFLVPHFALNGISFNMEREIDREWGLQMCLEFVRMSDEIIVIGDKVTKGMQAEIEYTRQFRRPVVYRKDL